MSDEEEVRVVTYSGKTVAKYSGQSSDVDDEQDPFEKSIDPFEQLDARAINKLENIHPNAKKRIVRKYMRGSDGTGSKSKEPLAETAYDIFEVAIPPHNLTHLSRLYDKSSYHRAAVDAKAANIVGLGFELIESAEWKAKLDGDSDEVSIEKKRKKFEKEKQKVLELLDSFNEEDTIQEVFDKIIKDEESTGNGYMEIGRNVNGEIGYIGHIPSKTIRVRLARDGYVQIVGNKYTFFRNYGDTKTQDPIGKDPNPNEIIMFKKYSPGSTYYGVPDIIAAMGAVAGNEFSTKFNLDYFENKAVPRYIISLKGAKLNSETERRLLEFFETGLKGQNHRSLFIPLPADDPKRKVELKLEAVENKITDSSFDQYHKSNRDEILMVHRVPISKIGIPDGVSLAIARDADKTFKEQVCGPSQRTFEKKFNKVIRELSLMLRFKLNELTLTDEETQSGIDERYLRMQVLVPNEVRARKGLPALPDGDTPVVLSAQAAAEQNAQARQSRTRDSERSANTTDSRGEARNPKGDGRTQE